MGQRRSLIAEDNAEVLSFAKILLEGHGYTVIEAVEGGDAINKFKGNKDRIEILLLDVIMPAKNGKEVFEAVKELKPGIKSIFMSGHIRDIALERDVVEGGLDFIQKPFLPAELLRKVRQALDA